MTVPQPDSDHEAAVLYRYLVGKRPSAALTARYHKAIATGTAVSTPKELKRFVYAVRHPWALGMLDGAAAFSAPRGLLRQRLLIMTALAETEPENAALFLSRNRSFAYVFVIAARLWWAVVKLAGGKLLMLFI